jgi:ribokinase
MRQLLAMDAECLPVARVSVLGSINLDLVVRVPNLPRPGDTVVGDRLLHFHGGKGANQAVAAARLGAQVRMLGRVGNDGFAEELLRALAEDRVDISGIARDAEEPSGAALILVEKGGQNTIAIALGANARVGAAEVERLGAGLESDDVLVLQLEVPLDTVRAAAEAGRRAGAKVVLNAAPVQPGLALSALPEVDVLVVNEGEASLLSGREVGDLPSAEAAGAALSRAAGAVVVTMGAQGSVLWESGKAVRVEAHPVLAVDATAAGDAFVGAVAYGLAAGYSRLEAVQLGSAAGALAATRLGARGSLPTLADVRSLLGPRAR